MFHPTLPDDHLRLRVARHLRFHTRGEAEDHIELRPSACLQHGEIDVVEVPTGSEEDKG